MFLSREQGFLVYYWHMNFYFKRVAIVCSFILLTVTLSGCGLNYKSLGIKGLSKEVATFEPSIQQQLEQSLTEGMIQSKVPGVIVGIWSPKGTWVHAQGYADIKTGKQISVSDSFRIASNSKMFTAKTIMLLAEQGKLGLDDKLSKYVAGVKNGNAVTIRQLLNMTSGIYDFTLNKEFSEKYFENPTMPFSDQDFLKVVAKGKPTFAPGKGWKYSNSNYYLLGMVIEKEMTKKAEDVIMDLAIKPMNLKNTYFPTGNELLGNVAHGYKDVDGKLTDYTTQNPMIPWTAGSMVSDIYDMKNWVKAYATGEGLSPSMLAEQLKWIDEPGQAGDVRYGMGTMYIDGFIGHAGVIFGYNTFMGYSPKEDATIIVMTTTDDDHDGAAVKLFAHFLKTLWPEDLAKSRLAK